MANALWVCHRCELIGPEPAAERHMEDTGHAVERLTVAETDGVREVWRRAGRDEDGQPMVALGQLLQLRRPERVEPENAGG